MKLTIMALALSALLDIGIFVVDRYEWLAIDVDKAAENGWPGKLVMRYNNSMDEKVYVWDFEKNELKPLEGR